jgi:hypothetical protein
VRQQVASTSINEFTFDTDESAPDFIVASFTDWLSNYVANGATFADGQTLQYGYTLLTCRVQSRVLRLLAPDFQSMPINWVGDLGPAFNIVAAHKYTPETFGFTPNIPALGNTAIIGKRFDEIPMFANRLSPLDSNPNDSGWFIGSNRNDVDNNDPKQLQLMSLYEAMIAVPHVLDFLSLPVGFQVVFSGGNPVVLKDYEELEIPKGSYLDRRLNAQ